jgi:hypothetical protein
MGTMVLKHFSIELPDDWRLEQGEVMSVYSINGKGAITLSAYSIIESEGYSIEEKLCIMAKNYIQKNKIQIKGSLIMQNDINTIVYGEGKSSDDWFVKLWVVATYPRVIVSTYYCKKRIRKEVAICDNIIKSIRFID